MYGAAPPAPPPLPPPPGAAAGGMHLNQVLGSLRGIADVSEMYE